MMNNLIKLVKNCENQGQIISLLKLYDIFDYVRSYVKDNHDVDFDGKKFIAKQHSITLSQLKEMVNETIYTAIN